MPPPPRTAQPSLNTDHPALTSSSFHACDPQSDFSDDSEVSERGLALHEESIWDRISALRDIIPPSTRRSIASTFNTTTSYALPARCSPASSSGSSPPRPFSWASLRLGSRG